jgi:hypothetical protein
MKYKTEYFKVKTERDALLAFAYQCVDDMKRLTRIDSVTKQGLIREEELRVILGKDDENAH